MDGLLYDENSYWMTEYSTTLELDEGQVVWIKVSDNQYDFKGGYSLFVKKFTALSLDTPTEGHYQNVDIFDYFSFTAPEDGIYVFTSAQENNQDMVGYLYNDADLTDVIVNDDDGAGDYQFMLEKTMTEGETVYLKPIHLNENESVDYTITVTKQLPILTNLSPGTADNAEATTCNADAYETYIQLFGTEEATSYTISIQRAPELESVNIWFLNKFGEGECVGYTDENGSFTWELSGDFLPAENYMFVKLVSFENPIGDFSVTYTYATVSE